MAYYFGVSGVWRKVRNCWVCPTGTWRRVRARWVGVGDQWVLKYQGGAVELAPATIRGFCFSPDIPVASIAFNPNGSVLAQYTDQTVLGSVDLANWFSPLTANAGGGFEIKATVVAGVKEAVIGPTLGQWLPLTSLRQWSVRSASPDQNQTVTATLEVAIRATGSNSVSAVSQYALSTVMYAADNPNSSYGKGGGVDRNAAYRLFQR